MHFDVRTLCGAAHFPPSVKKCSAARARAPINFPVRHESHTLGSLAVCRGPVYPASLLMPGSGPPLWVRSGALQVKPQVLSRLGYLTEGALEASCLIQGTSQTQLAPSVEICTHNNTGEIAQHRSGQYQVADFQVKGIESRLVLICLFCG